MIASVALLITTLLSAHGGSTLLGHQETLLPPGAARFKAVATALEASPARLRDPALQASVVDILEQENATIVANLENVRQTGQSRLPPDYGEYYADVLGVADRIRREARPADPELLARLQRALVKGGYNPDSPFAGGLADEGEPLVPYIEELLQGDIEHNKPNAYALVGGLLRLGSERGLRVALSDSSRQHLIDLARQGLAESDAEARRWAIGAIVAARDKESLPALRRLAQTDPDGAGDKSPYSVRALAGQAADTLSRIP